MLINHSDFEGQNHYKTKPKPFYNTRKKVAFPYSVLGFIWVPYKT